MARARPGDFVPQLQADLPGPVPFAKIFRFAATPNHLYKPAIPSRTGALAIVTNVGAGCGGRGSVGRDCGRRAVSVSDHAARRTNGASTPPPKLRPAARGRLRDWWRLLRTAKPCGPGTRCWCQADGGFLDPTGFRSTANLSATVTRRIRRRGEHVISRQNHCAGNAG
jgi:hypothetical protein